MQPYVDRIKSNLKTLFKQKREMAFSLMNEKKQIVFQLIAPLLHLNHFKLPGFVDKAPSGIFNYKMSAKSSALLLAQFDWQANEIDPSARSISALYSMGSTGTLGQTNDSDIDIWVCLESTLSDLNRSLLHQKTQRIEKWAEEMGVSLHFYLVDVNRFKKNHHDCLTQQNCGSAQHVLLLEEFYRSAFRLAGKWLMWYLVPADWVLDQCAYASYEDCVRALIDKKELNLEEWLDFGALSTLSQREYFGACLWQLYQCIDSPFKSTLKAILLESYVITKNSSFLAFKLLNKIQQDQIADHNYLDAYVMLFEAIEHYFIEMKDFDRLELARRCFYIKMTPHLCEGDDILPDWKKKWVIHYVRNWQWDRALIDHLEHLNAWSIFEICHLDQVILRTIMQTYKKLSEFGRIHNIDSQLNLTDLSLLTRKLYVAYEESPQKIKCINRSLTAGLNQAKLTFVFVPKNAIHLSGWYLYNQAPQLPGIIENDKIHYAPRLVKAVAFAYLNEIIGDQTQLYYFQNGKKDITSMRFIWRALQQKLTRLNPNEEAPFLEAAQVTDILIFINSEQAITENEVYQNEWDDAFIQEIDILYQNSWGEIKHLYFSGELALIDALTQFVKKIQRKGQAPKQLSVISVPEFNRDAIEKKIGLIFKTAIQYRLADHSSQSARFMPLRLNGQSWYLFFERFGISAHQFNNKLALFDAVTTNKIKGHVHHRVEVRDALPLEIDTVAKEGVIQFFFHDHETGFDLYILNEKNQVEICRNCSADKALMIREVSQFFVLTCERSGASALSKSLFNVPQFYQILSIDEKNQMILPYHLC